MNLPAREELVKTKTREFVDRMAYLMGTDATYTEQEKTMLDEFDMLAEDWVYSDVLEWEGSMPFRKLEKILEQRCEA